MPDAPAPITDIIRALVAGVIDDDCVWWPTVTPGQCVGMLDADGAAEFARRCEAYVAGQTVGGCDASGRLTLRFEAVAAERCHRCGRTIDDGGHGTCRKCWDETGDAVRGETVEVAW